MITRIAVYEDNRDFRDALVQLINNTPGYVCVSASYNCSHVLEELAVNNPDVILMDIEMAGGGGIEGLKNIRTVNSNTKVIMLTMFEDNQHVLEAICSGASGYILKKNVFNKLSAAIEEVMAGGAPLSPPVARMVLQFMQNAKLPTNNDFNLTVREKEILKSLVSGNSFKMIGFALNISVETVRTHIKKIYEKLQVNSQTEAVAKALKNNLG